MSTRTKLLVGLGVICLLAMPPLFHFGPPGIKAGQDIVLSSLRLTNGSTLFLVAHRTGHLIDAYEVNLFRLDQENNVYVAWLGYEDGYWWGAALVPEPPDEKVRIRAFGGTIGLYSVTDGSIEWRAGATKTVPSYKVDGVKIVQRIPEIILTNRN